MSKRAGERLWWLVLLAGKMIILLSFTRMIIPREPTTSKDKVVIYLDGT